MTLAFDLLHLLFRKLDRNAQCESENAITQINLRDSCHLQARFNQLELSLYAHISVCALLFELRMHLKSQLKFIRSNALEREREGKKRVAFILGYSRRIQINQIRKNNHPVKLIIISGEAKLTIFSSYLFQLRTCGVWFSVFS